MNLTLKCDLLTHLLGILVDCNLKFVFHIQDIVCRASKRAHLIFRCFLSRNTNILIKAFVTYVRPLLEYASSVWSPSYLYLITHIESVQKSFTKRLPFCKPLSYAERLTNLKLQSLEHRRLIFDLVLVFKIVHGYSCLNFADFFSFSNTNRSPRGHHYRLYVPLNKINTRKFFFSSRVIPAWNSLPLSLVTSPNFKCFRKSLIKYDLSKFLEFPSFFA